MEWSIQQLSVAVLLLQGLVSAAAPNANTPTVQTQVVQEAVHAVVSSTTPVRVIPKVPDVPVILLRIAGCEADGNPNSPPRQFNANGTVLRGKINPLDIGAYQINLRWNGEAAKRLGYDLFTLEGNTKMALYLYKINGTRDWNWSKHCWS